MPHPTPFHPRTSALNTSYLWKEWNGYAAVRTFDAHSEQEYFAVRHKAGAIDVSPLCKYEVRGPDAARLLSRVFSRDMERVGPRRMTYGVLVDPAGKVLDDGTCGRIGDQHFRLSTSERWLGWLQRHARGLKVDIEDSTERIAVLAVQGPRARDVCAPLVDFDLARMPFFRIRPCKLAGLQGWISRTGYTGDLGYELWVERDDALALWDAVFESGAPHGLLPYGLDALDVVRIEAGYILNGIDYYSARGCLIEARKSTPHDAGLGFCVDLEDRRTPVIGQQHIEREVVDGPVWDLVGLELDWEGLEELYARHGVPPHLAPCASRSAVPVFARDGRTQVGQATSHTWSPILKKPLALATVKRGHAQNGTILQIEHTVEFFRRTVKATVVCRTFFDPPRKRWVKRVKKQEAA